MPGKNRQPRTGQLGSNTPHDQRGKKRKSKRGRRGRSTLAIKKKEDMVAAAVKKKY